MQTYAGTVFNVHYSFYQCIHDKLQAICPAYMLYYMYTIFVNTSDVCKFLGNEFVICSPISTFCFPFLR